MRRTTFTQAVMVLRSPYERARRPSMCQRCGVVVDPRGLTLHESWHAEVDLAGDAARHVLETQPMRVLIAECSSSCCT